MTNARRAGERARATVVSSSVRAGKRAGTDARALVHAVSDLVTKAVDQVLLGDERVGSAAEAQRLLKRDEQTEALAGEIHCQPGACDWPLPGVVTNGALSTSRSASRRAR